ncbi:hypothetical protein Ancab_024473 [Ancistrocladus abbreviatus]
MASTWLNETKKENPHHVYMLLLRPVHSIFLWLTLPNIMPVRWPLVATIDVGITIQLQYNVVLFAITSSQTATKFTVIGLGDCALFLGSKSAENSAEVSIGLTGGCHILEWTEVRMSGRIGALMMSDDGDCAAGLADSVV